MVPTLIAKTLLVWLLLFPSPAAGATPQGAQNTRSPHGALNLPCQNCHTVYGWKPIRGAPEFDHNGTKFPLRGMHEGVACTACHTKLVFSNVGNKCADCHADIHRGKMGAACENCHTVRGWKVSVQQINQHMNRFPLTGAHAAAACDSCHKNGALSNFNTMSTACYSCHQKEFASAKNPDHAAGKFSTKCETCHTADSWANANFDHSLTGFPLTGGHSVPPRACTDCHVNNNYNLPVTACVGCHLKDFQNTNNPNHAQQGFAQTCETCHTTAAWSPAQFDHSKSGFPLTGKHTVPPRACADCHANNNYNITDTTCVSCHLKDFQGTNNPNHVQGGFPQTCQTCHTTSGWSPANFDHNKTGFPLNGAHTVPPRQCGDCHVNNNYNIKDTTCVSCHLKDFQGTNNPNHAQQGFSQKCETCHTTTAWQPAQFDHSKSGFPLTGSHTVPPRACADCHVNNNYNITDTSCVSCHQNDYNNAKTPIDHIAANFPTTCATCHDTVKWTNGKFDHAQTGWALTGQHTVPPRACTDCHVNGNYNLTQTTCVTCHLTDYNNTNNPNHKQQGFAQTCEVCHTTSAWQPAQFDHSKSGFPLTGAHTVPPRQCTDCHVNNNYNITDTSCVSCHQNDYNNAKSPVDHVGAKFPTTCATCHDTVQWSDGKFDHAQTGWALTGSHTVPPRLCTDCHVNNNYKLTQTACVSCHQTDYNNAKTPVDHIAAKFSTTCQTCHDTVAWTNGKFDHSQTGWTLTGQHTVPPRQCVDCHVNGNYNITQTTCVSCHLKDFQDTKNPDHVGGNFPQTCETCHSTSAWSPANFDHSKTGFPLTGAHTVPPRQCSDCHINGNYNITNTSCVSCHQADYNNAKTPVDHVAAKFPTTCEACHDTVQWSNGKFDHAQTGWALTGQHTVPPRQCVDCHVNGNYNITQTTCVSCHLKDFQGAKNPDHVAGGFPQTCESCHTTNGWSPANFDHSKTGFPLTGSHTVPPRACADCHINGNYNITNTACVSCHQTDYNNAKTPVDHITANFPTTCETCHDTVAWTNGKFDHAQTGWALTGKHTVPPRACTDCHVNNNYKLNNTACVACHQTDYNNTNNPNHAQAGFPTTCEVCHDTVAWTDANFDHSKTGFPLTGAHTVPPRVCTDCHVNNNYNLGAMTCYACHKTDYQQANNPNHVAAGFPTTCDMCHDTIKWADGKFNHTWFPTNHGNANGVCTTCHTNPNDFSVFTCTNCHTKSQTDPKHQGVRGYVYNSANCYQCHKNGGGG